MSKTCKLTSLALLAALGMVPLHATLGETEAQCVAKYGTEFEVKDGLGYDVVGDRAVTFHVNTPSGALNVRVVFLRGTVAHEEISSMDPSHPLSEPQMKALLDSESAGLTWRKRRSLFRTDNTGSTTGQENWLRSDGAIAKFWVNGKAGSRDLFGQLEIATKPFADAQAFYDKQDGTN